MGLIGRRRDMTVGRGLRHKTPQYTSRVCKCDCKKIKSDIIIIVMVV